MNSINPKAMTDWAVAGICSVALHVVVIVLLVLTGGSAPQPMDPAVAQSTVSSSSSEEDPGAPAATEPETPPTEIDTVAPSRTSNRAGTRTPAAASSSNRNARSNAKPATPAPAGNAPAKTKSYKVKPGDNLTRLARDCGSTPEELAKLNGVEVKKLADLKVGQTIKIKDND